MRILKIAFGDESPTSQKGGVSVEGSKRGGEEERRIPEVAYSDIQGKRTLHIGRGGGVVKKSMGEILQRERAAAEREIGRRKS